MGRSIHCSHPHHRVDKLGYLHQTLNKTLWRDGQHRQQLLWPMQLHHSLCTDGFFLLRLCIPHQSWRRESSNSRDLALQSYAYTNLATFVLTTKVRWWCALLHSLAAERPPDTSNGKLIPTDTFQDESQCLLLDALPWVYDCKSDHKMTRRRWIFLTTCSLSLTVDSFPMWF